MEKTNKRVEATTEEKTRSGKNCHRSKTKRESNFFRKLDCVYFASVFSQHFNAEKSQAIDSQQNAFFIIQLWLFVGLVFFFFFLFPGVSASKFQLCQTANDIQRKRERVSQKKTTFKKTRRFFGYRTGVPARQKSTA